MNESTVRFAVEKGYFVCENEIFRLPLPTIEKLTYLSLTRYAGSSKRAWPAYDTLARDVSCSKRRVIDAVSNLVKCGLVAKESRGNRTNVYLLYPPEYFCLQETHKLAGDKGELQSLQTGLDVVEGGESPAPLPAPTVNNIHPKDAPPAYSGCNKYTPTVQEVHPNINKINKQDNLTLKKRAPDIGENVNIKKTGAADEVEAVKEMFRAKKCQVSEKLIGQLLREHPLEAIGAAVGCTDFKVARNPVAVIQWMLSTGSYTLPLKQEGPEAAYHDEPPEPVDDKLVREMIREAKEGLRKKTTQTA